MDSSKFDLKTGYGISQARRHCFASLAKWLTFGIVAPWPATWFWFFVDETDGGAWWWKIPGGITIVFVFGLWVAGLIAIAMMFRIVSEADEIHRR